MWTLVTYSLVPISVALLIGVVTAWWAFGPKRENSLEVGRKDSPS